MVLIPDLLNLDIVSGQCVNKTIPQNVTFGEQGGVLGNNNAAVPVHFTQLFWVPLLATILGSVLTLDMF